MEPAEQEVASLCLIPFNQVCLLRVQLDLFSFGNAFGSDAKHEVNEVEEENKDKDEEVGIDNKDQDDKDGLDTTEGPESQYYELDL